MLGEQMTDDDRAYYARMDALIAALPQERQRALIHAIKLILRTFTEEDTHGVLLLADGGGYLTTMGLNSTYYESAALVHASSQLFNDTAAAADEEVKH